MGELRLLLASNAHYFNAHKMAPILLQVLERPADENMSDEKLQSYLLKAQSSVKAYENLKDLTCKDIAAAIAAARELGHPQAEELSDVIVRTVAQELQHLSASRCSFFITAFAKQKIFDATFWRAAARAVEFSQEPFTPQVLVSFFDAFRKSGARSQRLFTTLVHRVYGMVVDLEPAHIPPIIATVCRVPLPPDDRSRVVTLLLGQWLRSLSDQQHNVTGTQQLNMAQILSLTVSLGLAQEDINTAVFVLDVSNFVQENWQNIAPHDIIVFLSAMQALVVEGSQASLFASGLKQVLASYSELRANAELSVQRLTQLSGVLIVARSKDLHDPDFRRLQDLVIEDLSESIQYCTAETLAEIVDIWAGTLAFWRRYPTLRDAVVKRVEEVLLEAAEVQGVLVLLQALLGTPGLHESLSPKVQRVLAKAVHSRGPADVECIRPVVLGTEWESLLQEGGSSSSSSRAGPSARTTEPQEKARHVAMAAGSAAHSSLGTLLAKWSQEEEQMSVDNFLQFLQSANDAVAAASSDRHGDEAVEVLELAAPFAQRLADDATQEVFEQLTQLGDHVAQRIETVPPARAVAALTACAVAGLPHLPLFITTMVYLQGVLSPTQLVEVLEACAALRLLVPDCEQWLAASLDAGLERRLTAVWLARLLVAAARLNLLHGDKISALLERLATVASLRGPRPETVAMICHGLYLEGWPASVSEQTLPFAVEGLWQVVQWLERVHGEPTSPPEALAVRQFILGLLCQPISREVVSKLKPGLQRQLAQSLHSAAAAAAPLSRRALVSDTTLKFRHEVSLALQKADARTSYDLDLDLGAPLSLTGPLATVDIAIFKGHSADDRGRVRPRLSSLWLLDGPEAFYRPFTQRSLQLVPAELRREEILKAAHGEGGIALREALAGWEGRSPGKEDAHLPFTFHPGVLRRLDWLSWAELAPDERLGMLTS